MEAKQIFGPYCSEEQVISHTERVHSINNSAAHSISLVGTSCSADQFKKAMYLFSIRTQYIPHGKRATSIIKTNLLMLYETKVTFYSEKHKKHINTM